MGLNWHAYPQGERLPLKNSQYQHTLLSSGPNGLGTRTSMNGRAATALAVRGGQIALAYWKLNRLGTDGSSGGHRLQGGNTSIKLTEQFIWGKGHHQTIRGIKTCSM